NCELNFAFVSTKAVLVKKNDREYKSILCHFPSVGSVSLKLSLRTRAIRAFFYESGTSVAL
ncbi:MAG: hypothetical protein J6A50_04915, partial [Clostridia bacterium]|nr:hypothetical protein [Clostridia bacterium]